MSKEKIIFGIENVGKYRLVSWICPDGGWIDVNGNEVPPIAAVFQVIDDEGRPENITLNLDEIKNSKLPFVESDKESAITRIENKVPVRMKLSEV